MPAAIDAQVKKQVVNQWLSGDSRDRIAADNAIGGISDVFFGMQKDPPQNMMLKEN